MNDEPNLARRLDTVSASPMVINAHSFAAERRGDFRKEKAAQDNLIKRD